MTRGAIYGDFKNREDLFLALVQARWKPVIPPYQPAMSFPERMRVLGRAVAVATPERRVAGRILFRRRTADVAAAPGSCCTP